MRYMIPSTNSYSILTIGYASRIDPIDSNDLAREVTFKSYNTPTIHNVKTRMTRLKGLAELYSETKMQMQ